jgi:hypothetical protein
MVLITGWRVVMIVRWEILGKVIIGLAGVDMFWG